MRKGCDVEMIQMMIRKIDFLIRALLLWEKGATAEKKNEMKWKKEKKIKSFLVATNVVASRPPERRPTGTPTARAKKIESQERICPDYLLEM